MADMLKRVPVREQDAKERATNFEEVCYGYNQEEAMEEASRCLNCKNAKCIQGCRYRSIFPDLSQRSRMAISKALIMCISESSALPAICGRVCPRNPSANANVSAVSRENRYLSVSWKRFVADYALEHDIKPQKAEKTNGHKIAVIGFRPVWTYLCRRSCKAWIRSYSI